MCPIPVPPSSAPGETSVTRLRREQLAKSTREFLARGGRVVRCESCLLALEHCICDQRPAGRDDQQVAFLFLMYQGEVYKPSNTGRLIADVVVDNYAFQWQRTVHDPALLALLKNPAYQPVVVFPHEYADGGVCIHSPQQLMDVAGGHKKPLFIMLDGTWREARKMFRSPYLKDLPVLGIQPDKASEYQLREAFHEHQLCTAEVGIEVLKLAGEEATAAALADYFALFRHRYLAGKANIRGQAQ
ncbi:MAG: DTW domain-containing protein [Oceanospirillaceae bacterium]|nr:DTW domain-containing protein [Oceanospirillaceae bacterium]MBT10524.1 DTW domain-containing protein [Oceanospirillaceae bacterium]|tara:strand:- start:104598 stop:105329 length:732 start_codon:yes stop_codon:yes gene_type:complete